MKHSRNETIKSNVGLYLKARNYLDTENFKKSDLNPVCSSLQLPLTIEVENESSFPNSFIFSSINNDPTMAETQFCNFKTWINDLKCENISDELKSLLFPLVCHLYIEMLRGGHKNVASSFLKRYQSVGTDDESIAILEQLATIESTKDIKEREHIAALRNSKYQVILSTESLEVLKQYLIKHAHIILLQVINCWFDLEDNDVSYGMEWNPRSPSSGETKLCNGYTEPPPSESENVKLEEIMRLVKEVPATPAPLLLYTLHTQNNATSGKVNHEMGLLAAGFSTSEVRLWSLNEQKLKYSKTEMALSKRIHLAVDTDFVEDDFKLSTSDSIVLRGHSDRIHDLSFIKNCSIMVSVSADKTMRAWDLESYTCRAVYRGHQYPIWTCDVTSLGGCIATGSHDRTAKLWSLERNYPLRIFAGHSQDVDIVKFHPNDSYLATGSSDKSLRLWSVTSGELVRVFPGHRGGIFTIAFSPDGRYIASAGEDKRIKLWDIGMGSLLAELKGHTDTIVGLGWSGDGEFIASCSLDSTARIWYLKNALGSEDISSQEVPRTFTTKCNSLLSLCYSPKNTPVCIGTVY